MTFFFFSFPVERTVLGTNDIFDVIVPLNFVGSRKTVTVSAGLESNLHYEQPISFLSCRIYNFIKINIKAFE